MNNPANNVMESHGRNAEHEAILKCNNQLITAVQHCITRFTAECLSKGLISEDVEGFTLTTNRTDSEKATKLMRSVRDGIKNDPSRFNTFINVLVGFTHMEGELRTLQGKQPNIVRAH